MIGDRCSGVAQMRANAAVAAAAAGIKSATVGASARVDYA